jgi:carbon monoxide dehydrogenase subunit G
MSAVQAEIEIATPVQTVWETIMNPDRLKDCVTIHRSVENASQPLEQGSTMDQVLHMRGVSFKVHWTLVDLSAPTTAQWDGRGPARSRARIRYELSPRGDDRTLFKYTNEFTPPGGMLGNVASRVIVGAASEREANGSLSRLKALLERD